MHRCASCKSESKDVNLKCGRCKNVFYCNRVCQRRHWKHGGHNKTCCLPTSSDWRTPSLSTLSSSSSSSPSSCASSNSNIDSSFRARSSQLPSTNETSTSLHTRSTWTAKAEEDFYKQGSTLTTQKPSPFFFAESIGAHDVDADTDPVHPCPICLEHEDDYDACTLCWKCGQLFCGQCAPKMETLHECPTCRNPFGLSDAINFANLFAMVHDRSPGRHTLSALSALGKAYMNGLGVTQNSKKAIEYYQKGVDQGGETFGASHCAHNIAEVHKQTGKYTLALKYYALAWDRGYLPSYHNIGFMYQTGSGVTQNSAKAITYYQQAADRGYGPSQINLGTIYGQGSPGVCVNHVRSAKYLQMAADQGFANAQVTLGMMYTKGVGVAIDMRCALKLFKLAALQNHESAFFLLGRSFPPGLRVRIIGLKSAPHINGATGVVVERLKPDRWSVLIDDQTTPMSIRFTSLEFAEDSSSPTYGRN